VPPVTHTHALFADQSHSIPDNLVALLGYSRAWNCSDPERLIRSIFARINALLTMSVTCGNSENMCSLGVLPPPTHNRRTAHTLFELYGLVKQSGEKNSIVPDPIKQYRKMDLTVTISLRRV
jgi:hypothetical protein